MPLLKLSFAEPRNGWVPVILSVGTQEWKFSASDVPNNPIEELVSAVFDAFGNREATVWWHLEPGGYYFEFLEAPGQLQLRVLFAENSHRQESREVAFVLGSKQEILLPLWHALRQFQSFGAKEPHWPEVRYGQLESFGEQLRATRS